MNYQQLLVAMGPLATLIVVMFGVFLNGRQLDSVRHELRAEIKMIEKVIEAKINVVEAKISAVDIKLDARFAILDERTKIILDKVEELDTRLTRLEERKS